VIVDQRTAIRQKLLHPTPPPPPPPPPSDDGDVPNSGWTKSEILSWLKARKVDVGDDAKSRFTKSELLTTVTDYLDEERDG
jgi:hypothetical protein